jgi:ABC-type sugar transport system ATPase subunit
VELLSCEGISKYFRETATLANDRIGLAVAAGERRAIVGENGAGKSTLGRIIAGLAMPDSGEIRARGALIENGSVRAAEAAGIGFVPQVSLLAGELTAAENIALGREPRSMGLFVSRRKAYVEAALLFERFGLSIDPEASVSSLSASERRGVEIARALARGGEVLILDEPTSILSESESERLFGLLGRLTEEGKAIILITHRLAEVRRFADKLTVLRQGRVVADESVEHRSEEELSSLMARNTPSHSAKGGEGRRPRAGNVAWQREPRLEPMLELRDIALAPGAKPFRLSVGRGEVLGVAALAGNGLGRLEDYASGLVRPRSGDLLIAGSFLSEDRRRKLRQGASKHGSPALVADRVRFGYVPSDREARGLCLPASVRDNLLALRLHEFRGRDYLSGRLREKAALEAASGLGLVAEMRSSAASLSGGTRQRLVLGRELRRDDEPRSEASVLVLAEPLQGLDLAAQALVLELIRGLAGEGSAILLLDSNVEEIIAIADRVVALYRGGIAYEGPNEGEITAKHLLSAMTGAAGAFA